MEFDIFITYGDKEKEISEECKAFAKAFVAKRSMMSESNISAFMNNKTINIDMNTRGQYDEDSIPDEVYEWMDSLVEKYSCDIELTYEETEMVSEFYGPNENARVYQKRFDDAGQAMRVISQMSMAEIRELERYLGREFSPVDVVHMDEISKRIYFFLFGKELDI